MIIGQRTEEEFKTSGCVTQVEVERCDFMTAYLCARRGTAREHKFGLPVAGFDLVVLKKRYRHERDLFDRGNCIGVDPKVLNKRPVYLIMLCLKSKDSKGNIRKGMSVYGVYLRFKTFKSIQALINLSGSKSTLMHAGVEMAEANLA